MRYFEPGLLHRNEPSGVLHGLLRVRHFAQDDGHIFCTEEQVEEEVRGCLQMAFDTYRLFDFEVSPGALHAPRAADRQRRDVGPRRGEAHAERSRSWASPTSSTPATAPSTGPKIDVHMTDSLGRSWQLGTVQLDYSMPARFGLSYTGADNPSTPR